ncbi:30S ribosomal protein S30e [[Eubacterium] cellulosolvens]
MPTHGSITKAGKVKSQTPKVEARKRFSGIPRVRGKNNARKRFTLGRPIGQNWMSGRPRRR